MAEQRFTNSGQTDVSIWLESWCEDLIVPIGSTLAIKYEVHHGREDMSSVGLNEHGKIFHCEGESCSAELDGDILDGHEPF
jgi:hypothetical protein